MWYCQVIQQGNPGNPWKLESFLCRSCLFRGLLLQRFPRLKHFHFSSLYPVLKASCINLSWQIS